jgi:methionyl-tRNA formyltransferase
VFCAPEKAGAKADPIRTAAEEKKLKVFQFKSLRDKEAHDAMRSLNADLGIMAFVLQFAPQDFVNIPKQGHYRVPPVAAARRCAAPRRSTGPSSAATRRPASTIFRPTDGLDEGPVILQKERLSTGDTLGTVYFIDACSRWACRRWWSGRS